MDKVVYTLSCDRQADGAEIDREVIVGDAAMAAAWCRAKADELDGQAASEPTADLRLLEVRSALGADPDPRGFNCATAQRTGFECKDHRFHSSAPVRLRD